MQNTAIRTDDIATPRRGPGKLAAIMKWDLDEDRLFEIVKSGIAGARAAALA